MLRGRRARVGSGEGRRHSAQPGTPRLPARFNDPHQLSGRLEQPAAPAATTSRRPSPRSIQTFAILYVGGPEGFGYDLGDGASSRSLRSEFRLVVRGLPPRQSIKDLSANGASVVVVNMAHRPKAALGANLAHPDDDARHVDCDNRALRRADHVGAQRPPPRPRLVHLPRRSLPPTASTASRYRSDGVHFLGEGAAVVGAWLLPKVLELADLHPAEFRLTCQDRTY